ncbi:MAG: zinc-dependent peptidase [Bacteroidota bacterium]
MNEWIKLAIFFIIVTAVIFYFRQMIVGVWLTPKDPFPKKWRNILRKEVAYYNALNEGERLHFEYKIQEFLLNYQITPVETTIDLTDKLLIAASGVIPIFKFTNWRYENLKEILVYPGKFNQHFESEGEDRNVLGMVGRGIMDNKMILSKKALRNGFHNMTDRRNTAIHEFVHLIDMADGETDGIPKVLLEQPYVMPWLLLMKRKIDEITDQQSDINPYGGTSEIEFFAVASEYFFERPKQMAHKHPELYVLLEEIFDQDMDQLKLEKPKAIPRNGPCPCQSGKKYKNCCGAA